MYDGVDGLLAKARAGVRRWTPTETFAAVGTGPLLVDTRTEAQRLQQGELAGAVVIEDSLGVVP